MNYKIIFSDLDGTLLNSKIEISEENCLAIKKLNEIGVLFVPSSGRTLYEMPECVRNNENIRYISYADGAVVLDKHTGERLCACMDRELASTVLDILSEYDALLTVRNSGISYVDAKNNTAKDHEHYRLNRPYSNFIFDFSNPVDGYDEFVRSFDEVEMICVFFASESELEECRKRINSHPQLVCSTSAPHNLEIFHKDAGKGNALIRLCERLGIPRDQSVAMGDSDNDVSMLKAAGLALAMGNAWPELLAVADEKICHHNDHGVKYVLEHYFNQ